jgi:glycosyltransferase involved in cell wall biosynthesis
MARVGRLSGPFFSAFGVRPEALPLSMLWLPRGTIAVRRRLRAEAGCYDVVLATGPPMVALLVARLGVGRKGPALVAELRDLWAANPAFDRRGGILGALERWVLRRARIVIACTPEAVADLSARHPWLAGRIAEIPNGFEPRLLDLRSETAGAGARNGRRTILHSGTLTADRPLSPLLRALERDDLRDAFRVTVHGHLAPEARAEVAAADPLTEIEVIPPSPWEEAIQRIARADIALITQARGAGDATAVASKVYEYLALGKPVLCLSDGGATEALLRRLGADGYCARLHDEAGIARVLERLRDEPAAPPLPISDLAAFDRRRHAAQLAQLLDDH